MWTFQTPFRLECETDFRLHLRKLGSNQILIPDVFSYSDDTDIKFQEVVWVVTRGTQTISKSTRTNIVVGPRPFSITGLELRPVSVGNWMTVFHGRSGRACLHVRGEVSFDTLCLVLHTTLLDAVSWHSSDRGLSWARVQ